MLELGGRIRIEAGDELLLEVLEERADFRRARGVSELVARIDVEDALEGRARGALVAFDELRERDQLESAQALRTRGAGVARDRRERLDRTCVFLIVEQLLAAREERLDCRGADDVGARRQPTPAACRG